MENQKMMKDGAVYLTFYLLLMIITLWVPVAGLITFLFLPVPFIFFTYKYELKAGVLFGLLSFFLLFLVLGPLGLPLSLLFAVSGVVIGELMRRNKEAFAVLLGGALSFTGAIVLIYIGSILILNVNPVEEMQNLMTESAEMTEEMFMFAGGEDALPSEAIDEIIESIALIAPALMVMTGTGLAMVVQLISSALMRRRNLNVNRFPPFREWGFPKAFIWYYLITYLFILIGTDEGTALHIAVANLTPVLETVMIIQGFALTFFFFHRKRVTAVLPVFIVIFALLFPILLHIIRILGIIDLGFDLRKRMNAKK